MSHPSENRTAPLASALPVDPRQLDRAALLALVHESIDRFTERDALAALANPNCTPAVCQAVAQNPALTSFYSVRLRLVGHRATPQAEALRFVHFLYWPDLLRLSVNVQVPATVRAAIDKQLLARAEKLALGERIMAARRCSHELALWFLFDPSPRVFAALLVNQRLREDDLLMFLASQRTTVEKLVLLASDRKWSLRYAIRKALVLHPATPRAIAASQLRHLSQRDLIGIHSNPATSVYMRRCIEGLRERKELAAAPEVSEEE
jgi:hypothetical protein